MIYSSELDHVAARERRLAGDYGRSALEGALTVAHSAMMSAAGDGVVPSNATASVPAATATHRDRIRAFFMMSSP